MLSLGFWCLVKMTCCLTYWPVLSSSGEQLWRGGDETWTVQWPVHRPAAQEKNTPFEIHTGFSRSLFQGKTLCHASCKIHLMCLISICNFSFHYLLTLFVQMEEIEYSCEKCSGKAATVSHKFSRLPRLEWTDILTVVCCVDSFVVSLTNIWITLSMQGPDSSPQTLQLQQSAVFKQQAGPASPNPQISHATLTLHRRHTSPSQPRLERTDGNVRLTLTLAVI